ncbi:MAG: diaminopropionate ammonia-lyase [Desulfobacteraceae bacterium]|nr:diaminopropionate ammonia-lyase [Desulfobacteraceae bacterium]
MKIDKFQFEYFLQSPKKAIAPISFSEAAALEVAAFHAQLPAYKPTRLARLGRLGRVWGVGDIFVKDESERFGLKAFKVLGSSYAVARILCSRLGKNLAEVDAKSLMSEDAVRSIGPITFTTATDGNHGRGLAWSAQQFGHGAVVYMPKGTATSRIENIRGHGALVEVTDLNYDDTVRLCRAKAEENGWEIVQDTCWEGYEETPLAIMQGYMTMCREALQQMNQAGARPTHVFVQAGVGSLAAAVVGYLANVFPDNPPKFILMEPNNAACFFASALSAEGTPRGVTGDLRTIMAGLACGEPNAMAWEILKDFVACYVRCDDFVAANGMRILANPLHCDPGIEAGESGAVGMGLIDLLVNRGEFSRLRDELGIDADSSLLLFNTEGATDPENYRKIVWHGGWPLPD